MIARIQGMKYSDLTSLLTEYGWSEIDSPKGLTFHHSTGARLLFPPMKEDEPVVAYHLTAVRAAFSDYDILPYAEFDMRILPYLLQHAPVAVAA